MSVLVDGAVEPGIASGKSQVEDGTLLSHLAQNPIHGGPADGGVLAMDFVLDHGGSGMIAHLAQRLVDDLFLQGVSCHRSHSYLGLCPDKNILQIHPGVNTFFAFLVNYLKPCYTHLIIQRG